MKYAIFSHKDWIPQNGVERYNNTPIITLGKPMENPSCKDSQLGLPSRSRAMLWKWHPNHKRPSGQSLEIIDISYHEYIYIYIRIYTLISVTLTLHYLHCVWSANQMLLSPIPHECIGCFEGGLVFLLLRAMQGKQIQQQAHSEML